MGSIPAQPRRGKIKDLLFRWRSYRLTIIQLSLAAVIAVLICLALGHRAPVFAILAAIVTVQLLCAPHHRGLWLYLAGNVGGAIAASIYIPGISTRSAALDALIGALAALAVAAATTPRSPVRLVNEATEPMLSRLATNTRRIAEALRTGDSRTAHDALLSLNGVEQEQQRLHEVLDQLRRSALFSRYRSGQDLNRYLRQAREIGYAVRDIRTLVRHAWWGVIRPGEPVPPALPRMLDTLADGLAVLRDELNTSHQPREARPLLISAARWVEVMRSQPLSISVATVAASADAAVLDLLIATGLPLHDADRMLHRPQPTPRSIHQLSPGYAFRTPAVGRR